MSTLFASSLEILSRQVSNKIKQVYLKFHKVYGHVITPFGAIASTRHSEDKMH
jgi:hypothetical protein